MISLRGFFSMSGTVAPGAGSAGMHAREESESA